MIKGREENKGEGRQKGGSRRGEEAHGRGDLASIHPPTLLAAEAQTVCSQQYMHLLVLFQEIITLCVCVWTYVCLRVHHHPKVADEQYGAAI